MRYSDYEEDYDYFDYDDDVEVGYRKRKQGGKRSKFMSALLALLLCGVVVGGAVYVVKAEKMPTSGTVIEDSSNGKGQIDDEDRPSDNEDVNGDGLNGGVDVPTEEDKTLKVPSNESEYIAEGLQMMSGASVYMGADETLDPAIRFMCLVKNTLVEELESDSTKQAAMLFAPLDYFDAVNENNYTYIDWINAFETAGKTYVLSLFDGYGKYDDDTSFVQVNLTNVLYQNMNRKFAAIGVIITKDGDKTSYQYSAFAKDVTYRSNARSVANVASAALNANALGLETLNENQIAKLKSYVNMSVDLANGLSEPMNDNSTYAMRITSGTTKTLAVGQTFEIKTEMTPKVEVAIWYRSSDTSILTVDDTGKVTAVKAGTAKVRIFLAGVEHTVTVTVS